MRREGWFDLGDAAEPDAVALFAAGALVFTARNFTLSRRTLELTEQGQVTERYTKAIEQLGSDKIDVRIGGVYALERVARDSQRDLPTVMEVLTAFIREHSHEQWPPPGHPARDRELLPRPDVQAALTVVGRRRDTEGRTQLIDLADANLGGADLFGAKLRGAFLGGANLREANLGGATLAGAFLGGADLCDAILVGADLVAADFSRAILVDANLADAHLTGAHFSDADLTHAWWPASAPVPRGWEVDPSDSLPRSNPLKRSSPGSTPAEAD